MYVSPSAPPPSTWQKPALPPKEWSIYPTHILDTTAPIQRSHRKSRVSHTKESPLGEIAAARPLCALCNEICSVQVSRCFSPDKNISAKQWDLWVDLLKRQPGEVFILDLNDGGNGAGRSYAAVFFFWLMYSQLHLLIVFGNLLSCYWQLTELAKWPTSSWLQTSNVLKHGLHGGLPSDNIKTTASHMRRVVPLKTKAELLISSSFLHCTQICRDNHRQISFLTEANLKMWQFSSKFWICKELFSSQTFLSEISVDRHQREWYIQKV